MTDTCPTCPAPVLATASGLLDPQPGRLGVHRPDGARITTAEAIAAVREGRDAGHHKHRCGETAQPESEQQALFDAPITSARWPGEST